MLESYVDSYIGAIATPWFYDYDNDYDNDYDYD